MNRVTKAAYGDGFPFSSIRADSTALKIDGLNGLAAMWCTKRGICVGTADGGFFNMTDGRYAPPIIEDATALHRFENGIHQYLLFGRDSGGQREGFYAGDRAEAEVWRAGVRVE